jgi:DNA-binding MarR family transcriptional regulator
MDCLRWIVRDLRLESAGPMPGMSAAQVFVLHVLREAGPLSMRALAERTATDPSSVSVVVRKLGEKGLVDRTAAAEDRRRAQVALTAAGRRLAEATPPPMQTELLRRLEQLSEPQQQTLAALLEQVAPAAAGEAAPMFFQDPPEAPQ